MAMSSPHEVPVKVLVSETLSERSVEGGNVGERRRPEEQVQRRPKKELGASRGKSGALGMPLSYGRQHGLSMDGVDSASERAEMENVEEVDKAAAAGIVGASPAQTVANLHNASNLPKEVAKQVEQYEMELRKNPREVSALMGWARLLVKVAKDVIATHTSPESVKTVRLTSFYPTLLLTIPTHLRPLKPHFHPQSPTPHALLSSPPFHPTLTHYRPSPLKGCATHQGLTIRRLYKVPRRL